MPDGGSLLMETSRTYGDGDGDGEWVCLRVSDTGHGMDDDTVQRVFDPFFTTKAVGTGTGLGLSTVYGVVNGYGGRISCKSEVGRGTSFDICLPSSPEASQVVEAPVASTLAAQRGNETILLVDDEAFLLRVMGANLEAHGYAVHTAASGESAVEFFEERGHEVDLVILDLNMPGMGGRACLEKLRAIDPEAKVIISSGYGARGDRDELMKFGASGFLTKPSELSVILGEIDSVLSA